MLCVGKFFSLSFLWVRHHPAQERTDDRRKGTLASILVPPPKMLREVSLPSECELTSWSGQGGGRQRAAPNSRCLYLENLIYHTPMVNLHRRAVRVVAPDRLRQYLSVCNRYFPIQGDVTLNQGQGAKLSFRGTTKGIALLAVPNEGNYNSCSESF